MFTRKFNVNNFAKFLHWYLQGDIIEIHKNKYLYDAPILKLEDLIEYEFRVDTVLQLYVAYSGELLSESMRQMLKINYASILRRYTIARSTRSTDSDVDSLVPSTSSNAGSKVN